MRNEVSETTKDEKIFDKMRYYTACQLAQNSELKQNRFLLQTFAILYLNHTRVDTRGEQVEWA